MRILRAACCVAIATSSQAVACGPRSSAPGSPSPATRPAASWPGGSAVAPACVLGSIASDADLPDSALSVEVAVTEVVDVAHAPIPANAAERIVFQQLYETLVRVDCEGRVVPGLASEWRAESDGRAWVFTIRDGARFADGGPVTAIDVVRGWSERGAAATRANFANVAVLDDRILRIEAAAPLEPSDFADPSLAVTRASGGSWPLGTTGYVAAADAPPRLSPARASAAASAPLRLDAMPGSTAAPRTIAIRAFADARDAAGSADLIVTRDARAIAYAEQLGQYIAAPLVWDVTHALILAPDGAPPAAAPDSTDSPAHAGASPGDALLQSLAGLRADSVRIQLARDVVAGEARAAAGAACGLLRARTDATPPHEFVYPAGDAAARGIAERLVALVSGRASRQRPGGRSPVVRAAPFADIARALAEPPAPAATGTAYVFPLRARARTACGTGVAGRVVVPLVDTRPTLLRSVWLGGIAIDAAGAAWLGSARIGGNAAGGYNDHAPTARSNDRGAPRR